MGIVKLCRGRESSIDFLTGALYTGSLIPMTSLLASEGSANVDALDLACLETLVVAWSQGAALLARLTSLNIPSTSLSGALTVKVGSKGTSGGACPCAT